MHCFLARFNLGLKGLTWGGRPQEEERERRMDYIPDESAIQTDAIEVRRCTASGAALRMPLLLLHHRLAHWPGQAFPAVRAPLAFQVAQCRKLCREEEELRAAVASASDCYVARRVLRCAVRRWTRTRWRCCAA